MKKFIIIITFIQSIFNYIPEINHVPRIYNLAPVLCFLYVVHIMLFLMFNILYFYISTFWSVCAVPSKAVCCSSFILCFPGMWCRYFLNDFEIVVVAAAVIIVTILIIVVVVVVVAAALLLLHDHLLLIIIIMLYVCL